MTNTLTADVRGGVSWTLAAASDLSSQADSGNVGFVHSYQDGSGHYQAAVRWHDRRTLAAATSETLDLTALTQQLLDGTQAVTLATLRELVIVNHGTAADQTLDVSTDGLTNGLWELLDEGNQTGGAIRLHRGGVWAISRKKLGWVIAAGTKEIELINNAPGDATDYSIYMVGT